MEMRYADIAELPKELLPSGQASDDILYIFFDKKEMGIKLIYRAGGSFYDPNTGKMVEDAILVDASSIEIAEWNDELNIPDKSVDQLYKDGNGVKKQRVRTIMVSPVKMKEIMDIIENSKDSSHIILKIGKKMQSYDNIRDNENFGFDKTKIGNDDKNIEEMYEDAKKYYERHGNLDVPFNLIPNIDHNEPENKPAIDKSGFTNDYLGAGYEEPGKRNGK